MESRANKPPYFFARHADGTVESESPWERFRVVAPKQLEPLDLEYQKVAIVFESNIATTANSIPTLKTQELVAA